MTTEGECMGKDFSHLDLEKRKAIEICLNTSDGKFNKIAELITVSKQTVSREVKKHRVLSLGSTPWICKYTKESCPAHNLCGRACINKNCHRCKKACSKHSCPHYSPMMCERLTKPPYVCNGCKKRGACTNHKYYYKATPANNEYRTTLVESRNNPAATEEELLYLTELFTDGLKRGLSIYQIIQQAGGEEALGCCEKTIYNYIDQRLLGDITKVNLTRRMYKPRKKAIERNYKVDKHCLEGRRYEDYVAYMEANPGTLVVEMDTVVGRQGTDDCCLLTIHFVACGFQLAFVREKNTSSSVAEIFDLIWYTVGRENFKNLFPVILTDNGSEFSNPDSIEISADGEVRTKIFYCHPYSSFEKGSCEVNHEFIRRIIPKGSPMVLTQEEANLMMSHINSSPRESKNNRVPYDLFSTIYGEEVASKLGIKRISPNDVVLKPSLLNIKDKN